MPNISKKREANPLVGYVQHLSPEKRNRANTMTYKTILLQTGPSNISEALLYDTDKGAIFKESEENKTPLQVKNYTFTEDEKIIIDDATLVGTPGEPGCSFQYSTVERTYPVSTVVEVQNDHSQWSLVDVTAKVISVAEPVVVGKKNLLLCKATIADLTDSIPIDIWQEHINSVVEGETYRFPYHLENLLYVFRAFK